MEVLQHYIGGSWQQGVAKDTTAVINPANQEELARVPAGTGTGQDVQQAVQAAVKAFPGWSALSVNERIQPLFKLKSLLESHKSELAEIITRECGKTRGESLGELTRAIENVETACGTPTLMQSEFMENIGGGIDEFMIRQPVGVCACITPFNFPGMIPFWFLPYAIACGNTFIVKPSEKVPMTMQRVFELLDQCGLPPGVVNLVHGTSDAVDALIDHPDVKAISFVGSSRVAQYVYARGTAKGKRVQAQGGAKNPVVVLPDADLEMTSRIVADSVYGCAGQRCLAASTILTVGDDRGASREAIIESARSRVTGFGLDEGVDMGPVITTDSRQRIEQLMQQGLDEGGDLVLDGRNVEVAGFEKGNFIAPSILEGLDPASTLMSTEIFGPVMTLSHLPDLEAAIEWINRGAYGNMACIFTSNGTSARRFRNAVQAGNIGINIGVAAPMAQFPFSGWKESFFGDLHGQGRHAIEFFTQTKVVVERWPPEWGRKF